MALDAWLPIGFNLPDNAKAGAVLFEGTAWQLLETEGGGRALVVDDALARRWIHAGLIDEGTFSTFHFGDRCTTVFSCSHYQGDNQCAVLFVDQERIRVIRIDTFNNGVPFELQ